MDYIIIKESQRSVHVGIMTDPRHGEQYTSTLYYTLLRAMRLRTDSQKH